MEQNLMLQLQSFLGIFVFLGIAWIFSENKKKVSWKIVLAGITFQFAMALLVLGVPALVAGERPVQHRDVLSKKGHPLELPVVIN